MNKSDTIQKLATALAKAQAEIDNPHKNAQNPHFKNSYADLAEIINTVRPVLSRHGLSVVQLPGWNDGRVTVETILTHESGEWISGMAESPIGKADAQAVGSATTYLRRYSMAAVCMVAQEDDDGQSATQSAKDSPPQRSSAPRSNGGQKATEKQLEYLEKLMKSHVFTERERDSVGRKISDGDRDVVSKAIEWAKEEIDSRNAVEAEERKEMAGAA